MTLQAGTGGPFDVAILGTGIGGSILGAILARHGVKVLLVEQTTHPRFAIGESIIPETNLLLRIIAERFDVPEIAFLSNFNDVRRHVSSACGVKRNFSFVYHRPGVPNLATEISQFSTLAPPVGPDVHYFRQDIDAYAHALAVAYGATSRQQTSIAEVTFGEDGVTLNCDDGMKFVAQFVVDAGGPRALIPRQLGLREEPPPFKTRSRAVFTHMVGVTPYDRCAAARSDHGLNSPLSQGTLHHIFDGGWIWVIPFDNHRSSTNGLCSVGLTLELNGRRAPQRRPEEEFREVTRRYPDIARQFEAARAVRPWIGTGSLQYSSRSIVGPRYCLLPHAAAFIDPLFSSGLAVTMMFINAVAGRLIDAASCNDFSPERFRYGETWTRRSFAYYDNLVSGAYTAFKDFELWNAWQKIWMIGSLYGVSGMFYVLNNLDRKDDAVRSSLNEQVPYRGVQAIDFEPYFSLFESARNTLERFRNGEISTDVAIAQIHDSLGSSGLSPSHWHLEDPKRRSAGTFTLWPMLRLTAWGRLTSPDIVRRHYFSSTKNGPIPGGLISGSAAAVTEALASLSGLFRDSLLSWNHDWRRDGPIRPRNRRPHV